MTFSFRTHWSLRALVCALVATAVSAQNNNVIQGAVYRAGGKPFPNVVIELKSRMGVLLERRITGEDGRYAFPNLAQTIYLVDVTPPKPYLPQRREVEFLVGVDDVLRVDFHLDQREDKTVAEAPGEAIFVQEVPQEARQAYTIGVEYLRSGKKREGLAALRRAVETFPDYYLALIELGLEYLREGDTKQTREWCERAARVNSNSASAHFGLGWAYFQTGQLERAAREFVLSLRFNRGIAQTHYFLGLTMIEMERWEEAETAFQDYLDASGDKAHPDVYLYLTSAYDRQGKYSKAVDALKTYLQSVPPEKRSGKLMDLLTRLERRRKQTQD